MTESLRKQAISTADNIGMFVLLVVMLMLFALLLFSLRDKPDAFKSLPFNSHSIPTTVVPIAR